MFCSTIISTVGRPSLDRAVNSVLGQVLDGDDFEVIVVNDSGRPLPPASWQQSERVQIIHTQQTERCVARNTGAAIALGRYLHFLDDDDWVLPHAFENLRACSENNPDVDWVYGGVQLVDRQETPAIPLHPDLHGNAFIQTIAGEWLPLQSSLLRADAFWTTGGFNPLIPGIEDMDLARKMTLGGDVAGVRQIVACVGMGEESSTTNSLQARILGQQAREAILDDPQAWRRMWLSAFDSYWQGRVTRAYFTSAVWNVRRGVFLVATSRFIYGFIGLLWAGFSLFKPDYWRAVLKSHQGLSFARGAQAATQGTES